MPDSYGVVVAAAGPGRRFGTAIKLKEKVGGKSLLSHSLDVFDTDEACTEIILVCSTPVREWIAGDPLTFASAKLKLVEGGESRAESVKRGVLEASAPVLLIHDGSRPNFGAPLVAKLLATVKPAIGAVPGWPARDAVAYVTGIGGGGNGQGAEASPLGPSADHRLGHVMEHPQAAGLYLLQTPQAYDRASFVEALKAAGDELSDFADDSALYVAGGFEVAVVEGRDTNVKVVTQGDLALMRKLLGGPAKKRDRYGGLGW